MIKKLLITVLAFSMCLSGVLVSGDLEVSAAPKNPENFEMRGLWVAYCDFGNLGLKNKSERVFTKNLVKLLKDAKHSGINTIFFHTRAFRDASYRSKTFRASRYLTSKSGTGAEAFKSYDPFKIVVRECRKLNLGIHAWMNPYRKTFNTFMDPALDSSTEDIKIAVKEIMAYNVDGIHFDDYFYHSKDKYLNLDTGQRYRVSAGSSEKRANCNRMVKSVYKYVKSINSKAKFGISPQGNISNCLNSGCDIKRWLKKNGYIDYIIPQIYWTDNWGYNGKVTMYTDRLNAWKALNVKNKTMYIGLALYMTGKYSSGDQGWSMRNTNMKKQVKALRKAGMDGFVLYAAPDINAKHSRKEMKNLKKIL